MSIMAETGGLLKFEIFSTFKTNQTNPVSGAISIGFSRKCWKCFLVSKYAKHKNNVLIRSSLQSFMYDYTQMIGVSIMRVHDRYAYLTQSKC